MQYKTKIHQGLNDDEGVDLNFFLKPVSSLPGKKPGKTQARLANRDVLTPEISLKAFKTTAVVDWVELEMTMIDKVHLKDINRIMDEEVGSVQRVERIDLLDGGYFHHFSIRFQEPDFRKVRKALARLEDRYLINSVPRIRGLEVSLDFYSKEGGDYERAVLFGILARHFFVAPDRLTTRNHSPRYVFGDGNGDAITKYVFPEIEPEQPEDHVRNMQAKRFFEGYHGATYYVGEDRDPDVLWRLMHKIIDRQNRAAATKHELSDMERRVRLEATLGPNALAELKLVTFDDLRTLKLTSVAASKLFAFRLPTFDLHGETVEAAARRILEKERMDVFFKAGVQGLAMFDQSKRDIRRDRRPALIEHLHRQDKSVPPEDRKGKGKNGDMVNWMDMVRKVQTALRHLDERVCRDMKTDA